MTIREVLGMCIEELGDVRLQLADDENRAKLLQVRGKLMAAVEAIDRDSRKAAEEPGKMEAGAEDAEEADAVG